MTLLYELRQIRLSLLQADVLFFIHARSDTNPNSNEGESKKKKECE